MSIRGRVVLAVSLQKIDNTPDAQARAQSNYQSLQNTNCAIEKCHIKILLKNVFDFGLFVHVDLVHIEAVAGLHHGAQLFHVPFHVKDIFRVGVGCVLVIRVPRQIVLVRKKRTHAAQHEDTFASVHNCQFVLGHQLFATKSSGEFPKGKRHKRNPSFISLAFLFCFDIIYGITFNLGQKKAGNLFRFPA